jgi:hypothetical protein
MAPTAACENQNAHNQPLTCCRKIKFHWFLNPLVEHIRAT